MSDYPLDQEFINKCQQAGACEEGLEWLRRKPRTWKKLVARSPDWAVWAMTHTDCPIDLDGLSPFMRSLVMAERPDCPIDLVGFPSWDRALVMISRHDCPIDLTGLDPGHRALVMIRRPDCPIDLSGLDSAGRAWVMRMRHDCPTTS